MSKIKAIYKDVEYFVISTLGEMIELAPTAHGAGSFIVHVDFVVESCRSNITSLILLIVDLIIFY